MGNIASRPVPHAEDESMGIADLFHVKRARKYRLLPSCIRRALIKLRLAAHTRVPAAARQRGLESIDSMGETRVILSAMGGWEEGMVRAPVRRGKYGQRGQRGQRPQSTADSVRGPWVSVHTPRLVQLVPLPSGGAEEGVAGVV